MIDTHCHLAFPQFSDRLEQVLTDARAEGVDRFITVATTSTDCLECMRIAEQHSQVWCTSGVHPLYADDERDWNAVREVAWHPKCVAWGELGLDNHYKEPAGEAQRAILAEHLELIESCRNDGIDMPAVVHCRDAFDDLLPILSESAIDPSRCVFHCFNSNPDDARRVLDFGAWISFTGIVTFKTAKQVAEAAKLVPADRIMVETDSPFLSPEPVRKVFPNEPRHLPHVVRFLADLRGVEVQEFAGALDANAERFFGLSGRQTV